MLKTNPDTDPVRLTGQKSRIPSEERCSLKQSCLVELKGDPKDCYGKVPNCPIKKEALRKILEQSGIHQRFRNSSFKHIEELGVPERIQDQYSQVKDYVVNLKGNISEGRGLLLKGSVGTMKTTLAAAILQEHITQGGRGMFISMSGLLDNIFTLKAKSIDKWTKFEQQIRETPLLVLDDLGAEYSEGWVLTKVDAIIAERYNRCRTIIITTNQSFRRAAARGLC